jgi:hypothetical protein
MLPFPRTQEIKINEFRIVCVLFLQFYYTHRQRTNIKCPFFCVVKPTNPEIIPSKK